jgi:hypothetical protein
MTIKDQFSLFDYADTASFPELVGLQSAANVRLNPAALAYAISVALGTISRNVAMLGSISASNLTGTNTGDETAATLIAKGAQIVYRGTAAGTSTYTATATPIPLAYAAGMSATITFTAGNTGAATINLNGLGAKAIQLRGLALIGNEICSGDTVNLFYDGTQFQIAGIGFNYALQALAHAALGGM